MRAVGLFLITAGFLAGSLAAVFQEVGVPWAWFLPSLALGCAGVAMVRIDMHRRASDESRLEASFQELDGRLRSIVDQVSELDAEKESIDVYDLPERIDGSLPKEIIAFAEAREAISHAHGAAVYADIMTHFAAAERYLHRVWSAAADGYIDEAHTYLARSREQFENALELFEAAASSPAAKA